MSRKINNINRILAKRIKNGFYIFLIIFLALIIRLSYLSIYKYESYSSKIETQSTQKVNLNSGRGIIYDRNNNPLTDTNKTQVIIMPKSVITDNYKNINTIKTVTGLDENDIFKAVQDQIDSELIEIEVGKLSTSQINKLEKINIIVEQKTNRYKDDNLLSHTIGYINKTDRNGVSGIEKNMNSELKNSNEKYISVFKAGDLGKKSGLKIIEGSISKVTNNNKNLKLTIDSNIQSKVEKIVDKEENVIAEGNNRVLCDLDPTAHAEVTTIREACKKLRTYDLSNYILYTSCEPCPMCLSAIIWSNIKEVYYGCTKEDAGNIGFRDDIIYKYLEGKNKDLINLKQMDRDECIEAFNEYSKNNGTIY